MFRQWHTDLIQACLPVCYQVLKEVRSKKSEQHGLVRILVQDGRLHEIGWTPVEHIEHAKVRRMAMSARVPGDTALFTIAILPTTKETVDVYKVTPMLNYAEFSQGFTILSEWHARADQAAEQERSNVTMKITHVPDTSEPFGDS